MTLKFALVGCGRIVKKHIEALLNIPKQLFRLTLLEAFRFFWLSWRSK